MDRLTQLQDAVDQLALQFVASIHFAHKRHDLEKLGPNDKIRSVKQEEEKEVDPLPEEEFRAGLLELSRDLILKEQQIEVLISTLPGLDSSERDQEQCIKELEEELKAAEEQRQDALKEKERVVGQLDKILKSVRRP
ncbi:hypothetical protein jhhlp_003533 [Lomentospora prolificans]|uniref:Mediator of RNA polymerase II transcription subunit 21 n=1 Tax=Lomentospora prolificans TaxID=41688 RepID=A0A2N3N910_9PEZI|nr:hypothetical protein jhhlp_003533 [Lomentospora prolificans]